MNGGAWIVVILFLLAFTPAFIALRSTISDLREIKRQRKKDEEEIRRMIDRM